MKKIRHYRCKSVFISVLISVWICFFSSFSVYAGQLKFDGVPVDITSADNEDLVIAPGSGGNTQIGDASGTNTNATSNDDLYITGILEANGAGYFDSTLTVTGALTANGSVTLGDSSSDTITPNARLAASLLPSADSTYNLGSSTLAFSNLYVDTISGYNAALALSPASSYSLTGAVTKSASTGNEVAYDLAATINKATSGNYTGLKLNVTETLAPGSADKLLDFQVGGTSWLQLYNGVNSANYGLLSLGSDDWDGSTSGFFSGSASGTIIAVNAISGFVGNLLDLQVAGSSKYKVAYDGTVTSTGSQVVTGDITPSADSTYNLGSSSAAWLNLYTDNIKTVSGTNLTLLPTSAYTIVGDAATALKASANDDLFVAGVLENAGAAYLAASSGSVGIGTTAPTAVLHLKAGTTAASTAPLKFSSGSLNTTAEAGAMEFLTDNPYITITTGAARKGFVLDDGTLLTSGRVAFATTNGRLTDDSDLTFATDTLSATKLLSSTSVSTPSLISTGAVTVTPAAGSNLNVALSTTGDFAVNTNQLYVDTSAANVGIGTTAPVALLQAGTSPNPGLVVLASGNVGVGMTNPGVLLHIGTGGTVDSASTGDVYIQNDLEIDGTLYASSSSITGTSGTDFKIGSASDAAATNLSLTFGNTNSETITFTGAGTDNFAFSDLIEAAGLTLDANTSLTLSSGTGVYSQTYTGTATPMTITADSMTTGSGISISADALAGGNGIAIDSTSTAFAGKLLNLTASGAANTTTRYGVYSSLTGAGTTSTNIAGYFNSQNGTTANYGLIVENGYVGIGTASPVALLQVGTFPGSPLVVLDSGRLGIGTTTPTAVLHLKAGTTAASTAPLKFTSGSLNTTAEAGAVEFLTDAYYGTITTGAARKTFAFLESPSFTTPTLGEASATSLTLTTDLAVAEGGTGASTFTDGGVLIGNSTGAIQVTTAGTAGQVLTSNGAGVDPTFQAAAAGGGWTDGGTNVYVTTTTDNVGIGTTLPVALFQVGTSPSAPLVVLASGNVGIGTTNPTYRLDAQGGDARIGAITPGHGDTTADLFVVGNLEIDATAYMDGPLTVGTSGIETTGTVNTSKTTGYNYFMSSVGIGTTAPGRTLDIIGTIRTTDTVPLMALAIYQPNTSMDGIGKCLSKTKTYVLDTAAAIITAGTNVIYTLKVVDGDGITSLGNLRAGDTATTSILNVTSFTGGTVPSGKLLIMDIDSVSGTSTIFRLEVHGHEQ